MFSARRGVMLLLIALPVAAFPPAARSALEQAQELQKQGKLKEARDQYRAVAKAFRTSGDQQDRAAALSKAGDISLSLGDYQDAIQDAEESAKLRARLHDDAGLAVDLNTVGLAYESLGNYPAALEHYQHALKIDRVLGNVVGEVGRLNNIGNIHFAQARYIDALESYQSALALVNASANASWNFWGRKLTMGNIATLYQQVGLDEQALGLYQQISGRPENMAPAEYAQILLNEGILYRHLGDPVKALETYRSAQAVFRTARNAEGEFRALRNVGIVETMDLDDLSGAVRAFATALQLSRESSNRRAFTEADLYLGEVLRRLHRYQEATSHLKEALATAQTAGFIEEQWIAHYTLGQIAEASALPQDATAHYREAVSIIESVRAGLRGSSLGNGFLADKRDVYDSLIATELGRAKPSVDELVHWMESSRARTLQDRLASRTALIEPHLEPIQAHIPPHTVMIELWTGREESVAVWITPTNSGVTRYGRDLERRASQFVVALEKDGDQWKQFSREFGVLILAGLPLDHHLIVVQDGPVSIPFEALEVPESNRLLIEQSDVSYLPSARLLAGPDTSSRRWLWPWSRQLVAFGDPPVSSSDALALNERWQRLPASVDEIRGIARILPGRSEIHLGADARKFYLFDHRVAGIPLLHISTHAMADPERPERSRILLASDSSSGPDYLFQEEVGNLDLDNVGLVTVSACDTARGKMIAGEGIQAFSQSFLAAGAAATITSMWKVADQPTAAFMSQVYYSLARGAPKAAALRSAKLRFLRSNSTLSHPRYWAAFVLTGDGWNRSPRVIPWSAILLVVAAIVALLGVALRLRAKVMAGKRAPRMELQIR